MPPPSLLTLTCDTSTVTLAPDFGGVIAHLYTTAGDRRIDWLRPTASHALQARDRLGVASFPLVPWCNRIRDGRARFGARNVALPPDTVCPHPLHGLGCRSAWRVDRHDERQAWLSFDGDGRDGWPWRFRAEQHVELQADALSVTLAVENRDDVAMPAGLGHHPYFPLHGQALLTADVGRRWRADDELFPVELVDDPLAQRLRDGLPVQALDCDTVFVDWQRRARIDWPRIGARLEIEADAPMSFLHLFRPPGGDFVCVEPVSNVTNWLNMDGHAQGRSVATLGGSIVEPGERLCAAWRMRLRLRLG